MKRVTAHRVDGVTSLMVKEGGMELYNAQAYFYQSCYLEGIIPCQWGLTLIVPLFKKNNRSLASNYRGVGHQCLFEKTLERVLYLLMANQLKRKF